MLRTISNALERLSSTIHEGIKGVCIILILGMTVLTLVAVFFRYVLDSPIKWAEELARLIMVWAGLLGVTIALKDGEHIGLEFLIQRVSATVKIWLNLLVNLIVLIFLTILLIWGWRVAIRARETLPALQIPWMWSFLAVPISAAIQLIHLTANTTKIIYREIFLSHGSERNGVF